MWTFPSTLSGRTTSGTSDREGTRESSDFYLRIVLHHDHCKGKQIFRDLLTVNNINHESYKAVCRTLGLLQDDEEWNIVLREASLTKLCPQIRSLFVTLLLFCEPSSPLQLFNNHVEHW